MNFEPKFYDDFCSDSETGALTTENLMQIYNGSNPVYIDNWQAPSTNEHLSEQEHFARFIKSREFLTMQKQFSILIKGLENWCHTNNIPNAKLWDTFHTKVVTNKLVEVGMPTAIAFYGAGKRALEIIFYAFVRAPVDKQKNRSLMQHFLSDGRLEQCLAGAHIGIVNLSLSLGGSDWDAIILEIRSNYAQQVATKFTLDTDPNVDPVSDIHIAYSLINRVTNILRLPYIEDVYDSNDYFAQSELLDFVYQIEYGITIVMIEQLTEHLYTSASAVLDFHALKAFEAKFAQLGADPEFNSSTLFEIDDQGQVTIRDDLDPVHYIRCSLIARFANSGYFDEKSFITLVQGSGIAREYNITTMNLEWSWMTVENKVEKTTTRHKIFTANNLMPVRDFCQTELYSMFDVTLIANNPAVRRYLNNFLLHCMRNRNAFAVVFLTNLGARIPDEAKEDIRDYGNFLLFDAMQHSRVEEIAVLLGELNVDPFYKSNPDAANQNLLEGTAFDYAFELNNELLIRTMIINTKSIRGEILVLCYAAEYFPFLPRLAFKLAADFQVQTAVDGKCNKEQLSDFGDRLFNELKAQLLNEHESTELDNDELLDAQYYINHITRLLTDINKLLANNQLPLAQAKLYMAIICARCTFSAFSELDDNPLFALEKYADFYSKLDNLIQVYWSDAAKQELVDAIDLTNSKAPKNYNATIRSLMHKHLNRNWIKFARIDREELLAELTPVLNSAIQSYFSKSWSAFFNDLVFRFTLDTLENNIASAIDNFSPKVKPEPIAFDILEPREKKRMRIMGR